MAIKPDDSSLDYMQLVAVEKRAASLLDRSSAWDRFPTPVADILTAADIKVAATRTFDAASILAYLKAAPGAAVGALKSAISKVFGIYDVSERIIHIDDTVVIPKQTFLKFHETGHHEIPAHRKTFRFFQDCEKTLDPEIAELFEREANNFARYLLFQGQTYAQFAADSPLEIKSPMKLATKFGASQYASCREFARTNHRACAVYILEPIQFVKGMGARANVRRIEVSPRFAEQFGVPQDTVITLDHPIGRALPIGRRMTRPMTFQMMDRNGTRRECVAEAFDTKWNVLVLVYPVLTLQRTAFILPKTGAPETV